MAFGCQNIIESGSFWIDVMPLTPASQMVPLSFVITLNTDSIPRKFKKYIKKAFFVAFWWKKNFWIWFFRNWCHALNTGDQMVSLNFVITLNKYSISCKLKKKHIVKRHFPFPFGLKILLNLVLFELVSCPWHRPSKWSLWALHWTQTVFPINGRKYLIILNPAWWALILVGPTVCRA